MSQQIHRIGLKSASLSSNRFHYPLYRCQLGEVGELTPNNNTNYPLYRSRRWQQSNSQNALQQCLVATGLSFTIFLTIQGHVYTCGTNSHGQLGHGDTIDRPIPTIIEPLESVGAVAQIAAGPSYSLAITHDGTIHSFGSGTNFCLGHGLQLGKPQPRPIKSFIGQDIHVVRVSAGDEHVVALDSSGFVCASKRKTFVLVDDGSVYGFGWMAFGSLGFTDMGAFDKTKISPHFSSTRGPLPHCGNHQSRINLWFWQ